MHDRENASNDSVDPIQSARKAYFEQFPKRRTELPSITRAAPTRRQILRAAMGSYRENLDANGAFIAEICLYTLFLVNCHLLWNRAAATADRLTSGTVEALTHFELPTPKQLPPVK